MPGRMISVEPEIAASEYFPTVRQACLSASIRQMRNWSSIELGLCLSSE